jgi:RNA polymerase sigma factor (sigma-70 family)
VKNQSIESTEYETLSDPEIIRYVLAGDTRWFALLVRRHGAAALQVAYRRLGDWHVAEDVCQEALLDSFIHLKDLRDQAKYRSWLQSIVRNRCRMLQRGRHIEWAGTDIEAVVDLKQPTVEDSLSSMQATQIVSELCNLLSEAEAPVARMYYLKGLMGQEIANKLNIATSAVETRLHKARKHLLGIVRGKREDHNVNRLIHHLIQHVKERYVMDTIRVELSKELLGLVKPSSDKKNLLDLIGDLREELRTDHQVSVPKVHVVDNLALLKNSFDVYVKGAKVIRAAAEDPQNANDVLSSLRKAVLDNRDKISQ